MFEALRWRLTAWYVCAFAVAFVVVGLIVFVWADRRLSTSVRESIHTVTDAVQPAIVADGSIASSDEDVRAVLANASLSGSADVFVILLKPDGTLSSDPSDVATKGLPVGSAVERARIAGSDERNARVQGEDVDLQTIAVQSSDGTLIGFIQAGKSVEEREASLRTLAIVMSGGGVAGLVLATVGGLLVASIAMRPVRRSFQRQREFVADASHELRTPLAVIRTNSESLAATTQRTDVAEAIDDIAAETRYMTRLLDDLLLLAGSDQEGIALQKASIDLVESARAASRAAAILADQAGLQFTADLHGSLIVDGDPERCREILLILLDNAVKYTPRGGRVTLSTSSSGGFAVVEVVDTGVGVAPEHVERLFDRFYRVDKARSRAVGGTGLGLAIARELTLAHGGTLDVDSSPGQGTRVTLRMRLATAPVGSAVADA